GVAVARVVGAKPVVRSLRGLGAQVGRDVRGDVGARSARRVHLDIGPELAVRVGARRVVAEEDAGVDVAQLDLDAYLVPPLLDQRLEVLPHRVGGGGVQHAEAHAVLGTDAVGSADPAGFVEERVGALYVLNLAAVVGRRVVHGRSGHEVAGHTARGPVSDLDEYLL